MQKIFGPQRAIVDLVELEVGDLFELVSDKKKIKDVWIVRGNPFYNAGACADTRYCSKKGEMYGKICKDKVIKVGESKYKEKYKRTPVQIWKGR